MNTANPDIEHEITGTTFFAFVEDVGRVFDNRSLQHQDIYANIQDTRAARGLASATHFCWLDCVRANYFFTLDWREERCNALLARDRIRRAGLIRKLDYKRHFRTVLMLYSHGELLQRFNVRQLLPSWWLQLEWADQEGLPSYMAEDFDMNDPNEGSVYSLRRVLEPARAQLYNVFSLDHLIDIARDDWREPELITIPIPPNPGGGTTSVNPYLSPEMAEDTETFFEMLEQQTIELPHGV